MELDIWQDDFSGLQVDPNKWQMFAGNYGTPYRRQTSTADNVRLESGILFLKATVDNNDNYYSGMVTTNDVREDPNDKWANGNLGWTFGKFEIQANSHGYGLWPALWMRPIYNQYTGADGVSTSWPANGDIAIMEYIEPGKDEINRMLQSISWYKMPIVKAHMGAVNKTRIPSR